LIEKILFQSYHKKGINNIEKSKEQRKKEEKALGKTKVM
jgi:hypothetical protein